MTQYVAGDMLRHKADCFDYKRLAHLDKVCHNNKRFISATKWGEAMSSATTQSDILERIRSTSDPITWPLEAGSLRSWLKRPGEKVDRYEPIAIVESDGVETEVTATQSGVVRVIMMVPGATIETGSILCYIQPTTPSAPKAPPQPPSLREKLKSPKTRPTPPVSPNVPSSDVTPAATGVAPPPAPASPSLPLSALEEPVPLERRPAGLQSVQEFAMARTQASAPLRPKPAVAEENEPRTKGKVYRLTPKQIRQTKKLALSVSGDDEAPTGPPVTESELIRLATELLVALPRPALMALVNENRTREQAGQYGTGWPRPPR